MKKRLKTVLVATALLVLLCPAVLAIASRETKHTHQVLTRKTTTVEKLYSHSHYCYKDGRLDWWPCGVYQAYERVERYCCDCGQLINSLCYTDHDRKIGAETHKLEY